MLPWVLLVFLAVTLPYLFAWWRSPEGMRFVGALINPDDMGVYVSAMRQGAAGKWLYHFTYSPEGWQPRLMLTLYLLLGKITGLFTNPDVFWLHLWRIFLLGTTLWALVYWARTMLPENPRWQWSAWLLILFGGGIGWLAIFFAPSNLSFMPDVGMAEWSVMIALLNTPHFALGVGAEAVVFALVARMLRAETIGEGMRWAVLAGLAAILATLIYVYHLAVIGLVVGLTMLGLWFQHRKIPWQKWLLGLIVLLPLAPMLVYYAFWTNGDPYWESYTRVEHVIHPPPAAGAVIGLGFLGLLALAGLRWWLRNGRTILLPIWAVVNALVLYLPLVSFSGRFALGFMVPVSTLAAVGLEAVILPRLADSGFFPRLAKISPTPYATLRRVIILLLVPSTIMAVLLFFKGPLTVPGYPYYLPQADIAAAQWLGEHSDESAVTMAYYPMGNFLPRVYAGKVFLGQLDYTTNLEQKLAQFEQFWDGSMAESEREALLREWGITHLFVGTYEQPYVSGSSPPPGEIIYRQDTVTIYRTGVAPDS